MDGSQSFVQFSGYAYLHKDASRKEVNNYKSNMRTKQQKAEIAEKVQQFASYAPRVSHSAATASFIESEKIKIKNQGENEFLSEFLRIAEFLYQHYQNQSWSLNEFLALSRAADLNVQKLSKYFFDWIAVLLENRQIRKIQSCYSFDVYMWI
jgi:hypothetical protein